VTHKYLWKESSRKRNKVCKAIQGNQCNYGEGDGTPLQYSCLENPWEGGGRWEEGSGWVTRVHPWQIHVDVWQNQYNIVK